MDVFSFPAIESWLEAIGGRWAAGGRQAAAGSSRRHQQVINYRPHGQIVFDLLPKSCLVTITRFNGCGVSLVIISGTTVKLSLSLLLARVRPHQLCRPSRLGAL